jgi:hypothetical protein
MAIDIPNLRLRSGSLVPRELMTVYSMLSLPEKAGFFSVALSENLIIYL